MTADHFQHIVEHELDVRRRNLLTLAAFLVAVLVIVVAMVAL